MSFRQDYIENHSLEFDSCLDVCGLDECQYYYGNCPIGGDSE